MRWFKLGILAILIKILFDCFPILTERVYQKMIFRGIRIIWDFTLGWSPVPLLYILLIAMIFCAIRSWRRSNKVFTLQVIVRALLNGFGFILFWFYALWGYNYSASNLESRLRKQNHISDHGLNTYDMAFRSVIEASAQWQFVKDQTWTETEIREAVEAFLTHYDYPTEGRARCRVIHNKGIARRAGILGIYLPFVSEGHADGSQTRFGLPFTMAHELSHAYGITDEGEANLVAYLSLIQSDNDWLRYCAYLQLTRSCLIQQKMADPQGYPDFRAQLPSVLIAHMDEINENISQYPSFFPEFSSAVNNFYLQSQGVAEGVESYDKYVDLVYQWKNTHFED